MQGLTGGTGGRYTLWMTYDDLTLAQKALYDCSTVHRTDTGPMLMLGFACARARHPHLAFMDDDWRDVSRLLLKFYHNHLVVGNSPGRVLGSVPQAKPLVQKVPAVGIEARIRELNGENLVRVARLNKVTTEVHSSNPGITAMRRKNALLALLRRGENVKV